MMRPLSIGYRAEVDTVDDISWRECAGFFADANIYQLWHHGPGRGRFADVSRVVLKKNDEIVAAAEVRLFVLPFAQSGMAYVRWGPLWRGADGAADLTHFRQAIRALRNEYVGGRGLVLRINPRLFAEDHAECIQILADEGLSPLPHRPAEKSLVMDLSPALDQLRAGFDKKWRNCLSKAERGGLSVIAGCGLELLDEFIRLYGEMLQRKQFAPTADIDRHRRLQEVLPEQLKMGVVMARHEGKACAGAIYSAIGDTALYLFGATNAVGMRTAGSYLVQWELLKLLKQWGIRKYDLHGINIDSNPGTYRFKKGLAGKNGREVTFLGQRQGFVPSIANYSLVLADRLRYRARALRAAAAGGALATATTPAHGGNDNKAYP